jgi:hypothetical protein
MRQFNYFANGGPFPGTCLSCGNNKELFDLGKDEVTNASHLLCTRCISEIASFNGYILREPAMKELDHLKAHTRQLEAQVEAVPTLVEGLINGIRSSVADFVLAVSSSGDNGGSVSIQDGTEGHRKPGRPRKAADSDNETPSEPASE